MPGTISDILGRLGLDRQSKVARKRDLDAAQRLFLQCAQGALGEAGRGERTGGEHGDGIPLGYGVAFGDEDPGRL